MFTWAQLATKVFSFLNLVASYFKDKQLMDAGRNAQRADDAAETTGRFQDGMEAAERVRRANTAELGRLRDKWVRPE